MSKKWVIKLSNLCTIVVCKHDQKNCRTMFLYYICQRESNYDQENSYWHKYSNTLKFANTNRVYFRFGQCEYKSLTQKVNNEVRVDLALCESNADDVRPFWWRQLWSQFCAVQSQRLTAKKRVFMFPSVHQVLIKVNKYLDNNCKSFSSWYLVNSPCPKLNLFMHVHNESSSGQ